MKAAKPTEPTENSGMSARMQASWMDTLISNAIDRPSWYELTVASLVKAMDTGYAQTWTGRRRRRSGSQEGWTIGVEKVL